MRIFAVLHFLLCCSFAVGQANLEPAFHFQHELNASFADSASSPLPETERRSFRSLEFFPVSAQYVVTARFKRTRNEKPFPMATTTDRRPMYVKYGELHFKIDGKPFQLNVYQNADFIRNPKYKDNLFLPFTDRTSGNETYGGGRYIDLRIPASKEVTIDFNQAYNPYCAYNKAYSCPIVPAENDINVEIFAGVKKYHD